MIKGLLDQSRKVDQINLCIPKTSRLPPYVYQIPKWMESISILKIIETEADLGPATKFIPSWLSENKNKDTRIIIVDDDGLYPYTLVENLINWSNKLENVALGCSGVSIPTGLTPSSIINSTLDWQKDHRLTPKSSKSLSKVDYLFGYAGLVVRAGFFDDSLIDYSNAPAGAFFEDDLWLSGHLNKRQIDRYVIPVVDERMMPAACYKTLDSRALCLNENKDGKNMNDVYKHLFR